MQCLQPIKFTRNDEIKTAALAMRYFFTYNTEEYSVKDVFGGLFINNLLIKLKIT